MLSIVLLSLLAAAPAPETQPAPAEVKKELFAAEQWYKNQKGNEQEFVGILERQAGGGPGIGRFNPYRLVMLQTVKVEVVIKHGDGRVERKVIPETRKVAREVYVGGKPELLAPFVGRTVKLTGKAVDLEVVGKVHQEIWPARLEVVAKDGKESPKQSVNEGQAGGGKELKVLARAPYRFGVQDGTQRQLVIRGPDELEKAVGKQAEQVLKALKVEKIDWKTQMLVLVSGGTQRTGGFRVEITKLEPADKTLTVHWKLHAPKGAATQALTHPAEVVLVERFDGAVKFDPPAAKAPEK